MPRHVVATFVIGLSVGAVLIALYNTDLFAAAGRWVHGLFGGTVLEVGPELSLPLQCGVVLVLACAATWVGVDTQSLASRAVVFLLALLTIAMLSPTLAIYGQLFEPASGSAALLLGMVAGSLYANTEIGRRRHMLRNLLSGRADPAIIRRLAYAKRIPQLEGASRPATAVTCRIINRGELAGALDPEELAKISGKFQSLCGEHLMRNGGVLDPGTPDYVRAHFGLIPIPRLDGQKDAEESAPVDDPPPNRAQSEVSDPEGEETTNPGSPVAEEEPAELFPADFTPAAVAACRAALELAPHLHNLSSTCESEFDHRVIAGIGIESGPVTTCLTGPAHNQQLGAIGNVAEFSLRLSSANGSYGSDILIGPIAFLATRDEVEVRPVEMIFDPAANHLTEIYQLVDEKGFLSQQDGARLQAFWEGVIRLRQQDVEGALNKFNEAKDARRVDPPLDYFISKSKSLLEKAKSGITESDARPHHARESTEI